MKTRRWIPWVIVTVVLFLVPFSPGRGEVGVGLDPAGRLVGVVLMDPGNGEGSDPWPWLRVRQHVDPSWLLNEDGDSGDHPDGPPSIGWDPVADGPEVAWARHDGTDYEVVVSRWEDGSWSEPEVVTDNDVDDLDPEIAYAPDGTARLTFWREGQVFFVNRPPGGSWSDPEPVDSGERSSVAGSPDDLVAWQRPAEGGSTEIVVASRADGWQPVVLAVTSFSGLDRNGDLDVRLESAAGRTWVAWEDAADAIGWCRQEADGTWSAVRHEPMAGASDEEGARFRVKMEALR